MLQELNFNQIKAKGWIKKFLDCQSDGMTGNMDKIGAPFTDKYWDKSKEGNVNLKDTFLGGMDAVNTGWTTFEQTGYWIDGMIRTSVLSDNEKMFKKASDIIETAIANADKDGYIGPDFLKDDLTWAHSVFFRSLMAYYSATGKKNVIEAMKKHYLRRPLKDVWNKGVGVRMISARNIADIEAALWLFGQTGDKRFIETAEESYKTFNELFFDEKGVSADSKMKDVTLKGMLNNRKVNKNHGVTYAELCKLPAILYLYTGKEIYKKAAVNAFEKVYRDQILIDGVYSSTEYLNGNEDSLGSHETCVISDLSWALGYLYQATGDGKYGDRIEDAVFNAGLGCCDDEFKGNQYFSCPNQVIADDTSNHNYFYRGSDWMSFAPKKLLACCAGNVHRFMPNYVFRSWLTGDGGKTVVAATYAPSEVKLNIDGKEVVINEITDYPFSNEIVFKVNCAMPIEFTLRLRVPSWAESTVLTINSLKTDENVENGFVSVKRVFSDGDEIKIVFGDSVRMIENAKGISVKKGALLYALPIKEKVVIEGLRETNNHKFPHYSLYPTSKWNYGLKVADKGEILVRQLKSLEMPWKSTERTIYLEIPAYEIKNWKIKTIKNGKMRLNARGKVRMIGHSCSFTPKVPSAVTEKEKGERYTITLVPYATTRLRISIFPKFE